MTDAGIDDLGMAVNLFLRPLSAQTALQHRPHCLWFRRQSIAGYGSRRLDRDPQWHGGGPSRDPRQAEGLGLPGEGLLVADIDFPYESILTASFSLKLPTVIIETALAKPHSGQPIIYR